MAQPRAALTMDAWVRQRRVFGAGTARLTGALLLASAVCVALVGFEEPRAVTT
jgi:hypothetical protein